MKYLAILLLLVGFATFTDAYAGVPVEKIPITSFESQSMDGKQIDTVMIGQQVIFISSVENTQDTKQSFVYGIWIENQKGQRVFKDSIDATLEPKSSFFPSTMWIPPETGNYTAESTVWKSNDNPTAFSAVWHTSLEVIPKNSNKILNHDSSQIKIENIEGHLFYVTGPYALRPQSEDTVSLEGVEFSYPYFPLPISPGGVQSVDISFEDGVMEHIGTVGPPNPFLEFTDHQNPSAGVRRNSDGTFDFLVDVEKKLLFPLKQFKFGISFGKIECKESLVLVQKYDGSPACVNPETKTKLIERGWNQSISKNTFDKKWTFHTQGEISSIDISGDGGIVAVGTKTEDSQKGMLYLLDGNGLQLWQHEFDSMMSNVAISKDSSRILTQGSRLCGGGGGASYYCQSSVYLYDVTGNQLWNHVPEGDEYFNSVSLSSDGNQVISNTYNDISYFDMDKNTSWKFNANTQVQKSTFLDDYTIVTNTDESIFALNNKGENLWNFTREYPNSYAMAVSRDGQYVISADDSVSDDSYLYLLDKNGNLLWKRHVGISVLKLLFSDDSSHIVIQTSSRFMTYDLQGILLWTNKIPSDVIASSDGSFLVGTTFNQESGTSITIFDGKGNIVSNNPTSSESIPHTFSLASNDRYFTIAELKNQVSFFEINDNILDSSVLFDLAGFQNSEELHVAIIPQDKTMFDVTIQQGDSLEIPWDIKIDDGYTTNNFRVSIKSSSPELESWITPMSPYVTINGVSPSKRIITIHPYSDLKADDYTVQILGKGNSMHKETGWLTDLDGQILGIINVNVIPKQNSLSIKVGVIHSERESFCVDMADGNGRFCTSGPKYQIIPITVFSNTPQLVKLKSSVVQEGGWIKFVPQEFIAGPDGTQINMIMAGYLVPAKNNPLSDKSLVIQASSGSGRTTTTLSVSYGTISVISDEPVSINLGRIRTNSNGTNFSVSGVVYDPLDSNSTESIQVNLSVGGLWDGKKTINLPSWLRVEIPEPSFVLNATTPYHFMITAKTTNAPESGTYFVAINQNINGTDFVELEELVIENIRH